ncbi:hypothetical protein ACFVXC_21910 [Streptomyces sp. NPDC058257]|uniref:hypothetical protein n=1 Tax=Streptomyces sp. NPDC058257 TaxID=3346409 RepID=UPI0036E91B6B
MPGLIVEEILAAGRGIAVGAYRTTAQLPGRWGARPVRSSNGGGPAAAKAKVPNNS